AIGADHEIELTFAGMLQLNARGARVFLKRNDLVVENDFCGRFEFFKQQTRKLAAEERHVAPTGQLREECGPKTRRAPAAVVHDSHFPHFVANAIDLGDYSRALGNVVAKPPEVDHIAAAAQRWRALNQRRLEAGCFQPEGERWSGDAGSGD